MSKNDVNVFDIDYFESQPVRYIIDNKIYEGDYKDFQRFNYNQLRTLLSVKKIDEFPCYFMHYYGDYYFEEFLSTGAKNLDELVNFLKSKNLYPLEYTLKKYYNNSSINCSAFTATTEEGHRITGRNYDLTHNSGLLIYTNPPSAYASISMVDPYYLGYKGDVSNISLWDKRHLLCAPYMPFDGMNECGVFVSAQSMPLCTDTDYEGKITIFLNNAMRLILDYAKNVDGAIKLIENFNITFANNKEIFTHIMIADSSGQSAVIEFLDNEMKIIRNEDPWQVVTNFILYNYKPGKTPIGNGLARYNIASKILRNSNGIINKDEAMRILRKITMPIFDDTLAHLSEASPIPATCWSQVYDLSTGELNIVFGKKFANIKIIDILTKFFQNKS